MNPTEFRECLDALHLSQRAFAAVLGAPEGLVRMWARGARPIPDQVATGLRALAGYARGMGGAATAP